MTFKYLHICWIISRLRNIKHQGKAVLRIVMIMSLPTSKATNRFFSVTFWPKEVAFCIMIQLHFKTYFALVNLFNFQIVDCRSNEEIIDTKGFYTTDSFFHLFLSTISTFRAFMCDPLCHFHQEYINFVHTFMQQKGKTDIWL